MFNGNKREVIIDRRAFALDDRPPFYIDVRSYANSGGRAPIDDDSSNGNEMPTLLPPSDDSSSSSIERCGLVRGEEEEDAIEIEIGLDQLWIVDETGGMTNY